MAVQTITYDNKVALNTNPDIANVNKVTDADMNEIKSVVNNNASEFISKPIVLFENFNNTNISITISDSAANYSYFEIFFTDNSLRSGYTKVANPNNKTFGAMVIGVPSLEIQLRCANFTISGTSITSVYQHAITLKSATPEIWTSNIFITKVLGYK